MSTSLLLRMVGADPDLFGRFCGIDIEIYDDARIVWRSHSARIFGKHQPVLQAALHVPSTPYNYNWNYPIARILSMVICNQLNNRQKWKLFSGETELNELLELLDVI